MKKESRKLKLEPQLVPQSLWGLSASELLSRSAWGAIREDTLNHANRRCEACGVAPSTALSCHELWELDEQRCVATLVGFEMHCKTCDTVTHMGRSVKLGFGEIAFRQLCSVNSISMSEAREIYAQAMNEWEKRSEKKWSVKVHELLLKRYPKLAVLEATKVAKDST